MSVCVYQRILLTAEPIWFSFTMQLLMQVLGRFIIYLKSPLEKLLHIFLLFLDRGAYFLSPPPPLTLSHLKSPQRPLGAKPLLFNNLILCSFNIIIISKCKRERGHLGCLLLQSPKFYINVFLFVDITTLGTLVNFEWLIH